jgi:hypothetical protein
MLLPDVSEGSPIRWKVWTLSTWLTDFAMYPENEGLLRIPHEPLGEGDDLCTDVLIIGGGNG